MAAEELEGTAPGGAGTLWAMSATATATGHVYTVTAGGIVDPAKRRNRKAGAFYPNRYHGDSFVLLTYAPQ